MRWVSMLPFDIPVLRFEVRFTIRNSHSIINLFISVRVVFIVNSFDPLLVIYYSAFSTSNRVAMFWWCWRYFLFVKHVQRSLSEPAWHWCPRSKDDGCPGSISRAYPRLTSPPPPPDSGRRTIKEPGEYQSTKRNHNGTTGNTGRHCVVVSEVHKSFTWLSIPSKLAPGLNRRTHHFLATETRKTRHSRQSRLPERRRSRAQAVKWDHCAWERRFQKTLKERLHLITA